RECSCVKELHRVVKVVIQRTAIIIREGRSQTLAGWVPADIRGKGSSFLGTEEGIDLPALSHQFGKCMQRRHIIDQREIYIQRGVIIRRSIICINVVRVLRLREEVPSPVRGTGITSSRPDE